MPNSTNPSFSSAGFVFFFVAFIFLFSMLALASTVDDTFQTDFNLGDYNQTRTVLDGNMILSNQSATALFNSGDFNSRIFDAGEDVNWRSFRWSEGYHYGEQFPDGKKDQQPDGNMAGNVLLIHFNDTNNAGGDSNTLGVGDTSTLDHNGLIINQGDTNADGLFDTNALFLDGVSDSVDFGDPAGLDFGTGDFTYGVWINTGESGTNRYLIHKLDGAGDTGYSVRIHNGTIIAKVGDATNAIVEISSATTYNNSTWHMVSVVADRDQNLSLFVDGVLQDTNDLSHLSGSVSTATNFEVGTQNQVSGSYAKGSFDELFVFNRTLTAGEILNMYRRGVGRILHQVRSCDDASCAGGGAVTVFQDAETIENDTSVGTLSWTSLTNVEEQDVMYSEVSLSQMMGSGDTNSNYLVARNFGFTIPAGVIIEGVEATIVRKSSTDVVKDELVRLWVNGGVGGDNNANTSTSWSSSDTNALYGSSTYTWGLDLNATAINSANFGIALAVNIPEDNSDTASVDTITMKVTYSQESFIGPDGLGTSFFTDGNMWWDLNAVGNNRYFQYRSLFEADDTNISTLSIPALRLLDVTIDHNGSLDVNFINPISGVYQSQFAYSKDVNMVLDVNFFSLDNNHILVDINYNTNATAGGTSIYADLNLAKMSVGGADRTNQLLCDSNNFSTNPVNCNFDWNTSAIADGNYFIVLKVFDLSGAGTADLIEDPGTVDNNTDAGTDAWTDPSQAATSDDLRATFTGFSSISNYLHFTNWGFSIPTTATVQGVEVVIERSSNSGFVEDETVQLLKGNAPLGNNKANTGFGWENGDTNATYGGSSDLWGLSFTPANINASTFGFVLQAEELGLADSGSVDAAWITVSYSTVASPDTVITVVSDSFMIDQTRPDLTGDNNVGVWDNRDINIHFTCNDSGSSGCSIAFKQDTNADTGISLSGFSTYDTNLLIIDDGNFAIDVNATDRAGNVQADANRFIILRDTNSPTLSSFLPANPTETTENAYTFSVSVSDAVSGRDVSGILDCDLNIHRLDTNAIVETHDITPSGGVCSKSFTFPTTDLNYLGAWRVYDNASAVNETDQNSSVVLKTSGGANQAPTVIVTFIDANPDNQGLPFFSYVTDGNITIDFNVSDADTNNLLVDINLSTSPLEATGSVIIADLNLNSNPAYCDDQDFTQSTRCQWDINIHSTLVSDANYYVNILIDDGSLSDYNSSDNNFEIRNTELIISNTPMVFDLDPGVEDENGSSDLPFIIDNSIGTVDIAIDATAISWVGSGGSTLYEFLSSENESGSCTSFDQTDWKTMFVTGASGTNDGICQGMNSGASNNSLKVGIKVKSPSDEPSTTSTTSTVTFYIADDTTSGNDALVSN